MECLSRWRINYTPLWQRRIKIPDQNASGKILMPFPLFWVRLLRDDKIPSNVLKMEVHLQMTKFDIKEYLEKIYHIPVMGINTQIFEGKRRRTYTDPKKSFSQEPEYKIAWISLKDINLIFLQLKKS